MNETHKHRPDFESEFISSKHSYVVSPGFDNVKTSTLLFMGQIIQDLIDNGYTYTDERGIAMDLETELCTYLAQEFVIQGLFRYMQISGVKERGSSWWCSLSFLAEVSISGTTIHFKPKYPSGSKELKFTTMMFAEACSELIEKRTSEGEKFCNLNQTEQLAVQLGLRGLTQEE